MDRLKDLLRRLDPVEREVRQLCELGGALELLDAVCAAEVIEAFLTRECDLLLLVFKLY